MERIRVPNNRHQSEKNISFSSSLLETIYNSIDEPENNKNRHQVSDFDDDDPSVFYRGSGGYMSHRSKNDKHLHVDSVRRRSTVDYYNQDFDFTKNPSCNGLRDHRVLLNSSSSSSDSSSGGGFSSSESDSFRIKPIKTNPDEENVITGKKNSGFVKTKSKAMKIYGDLKKVKQPISPGGKLASFINSLFNANNTKKAKIGSATSPRLDGFGSNIESVQKIVRSKSSKPETSTNVYTAGYSSSTTPTCSSASSFTRSCLSKTPSSSSSRVKPSEGSVNGGGVKRSVRFCPVSFIVDEDCRPCGHKSLHGNQETINGSSFTSYNSNIVTTSKTTTIMSINTTRIPRIVEENQRVEEVIAREILKKYKNVNEINKKHNVEVDQESSDDEDDDDDNYDDDVASCASSDLFELDNLSSIGIDQRYCEDLPVYETTHVGTNRAIANGLIM